MAFLYSLFLKLLYPTSLCTLLLVAAAGSRKRQKLSRGCFWAAFANLMVGGNGWVVSALTKNLEWRYSSPEPAPSADAILVVRGGLLDKVPPRRLIEVDREGNRVIYGAQLYKQQKASVVFCTSGIATGGMAARPAVEVIADFLAMLGVPKEAVDKMTLEDLKRFIYEHANNDNYEQTKIHNRVFTQPGQ